VGDAAAAQREGGDTVFTMSGAKRRKVRDDALARVADGAGDAADGGAWAPARAAKPVVSREDLSSQQKEYIEWHAARREANLRARGKLKDEAEGALVDQAMGGARDAVGADDASRAEKSFFHGTSEKNYAGESWITPPKDRKKENDHCYAPKRCIHTWSGHTKGVQAIRFFPNHGHLILSAGLDSKIKIWDVHNSGKCMRTYLGHDKAVKDIQFTNDGTKFVSSSWDKKIKLWDTETGKVISTFTSGKIAYASVLHPNQQNILMAAQSDKKILQYDMNSGDVVQEYDQHLGAVNTVTFVDEGRRFVTTSDDKSMRVWEFGIPVVMKYIADPTMHSMPAVTLSPTGAWLAAQSLDNQIMIYSAKDKFRLNTKKRFTGHANGGYACQPNFSPDGRFLMSGDADGKCHFWDWKSKRIFKTLRAHDKVTIGCEWHPLETSKVATCSWDGTIKYWD
jgi:pre-mRNA-processing factor 17